MSHWFDGSICYGSFFVPTYGPHHNISNRLSHKFYSVDRQSISTVRFIGSVKKYREDQLQRKRLNSVAAETAHMGSRIPVVKPYSFLMAGSVH